MAHRPGMGRTKRVLLREIEIRRGRVVCPGCETPQEPARLTKHHILPRRDGGPTVLENLVLVCRPCHDAIHRDPRGEVPSRVAAFLAGRDSPGVFPPPPDPMPPEEGLRLFLHRMAAQIERTVAHARYAENPPFDPFWPVGRHFAPAELETGVVRFPVAA